MGEMQLLIPSISKDDSPTGGKRLKYELSLYVRMKIARDAARGNVD